jgi:hypothetical protein
MAELAARSAAFRTLESTVVRPGPRRPRAVSSAHGPLRHVLFAYPAYAAGELSYRAVYEDLFSKLPATTRLTVLTHPDVTADLEAALEAAGAAERTIVVEGPAHLRFLVWAEDPYVAVQDAAGEPPVTYLVEPYTFTRVGDAAIADLVADATAVQSTQSPLYFQGGNVLIGDDFVLIGADYPANTLALIDRYGHIEVPAGEDVNAFVRRLYRETLDPDREVLYVGTRLPVPRYTRRPFELDGETWIEELYLGTGTAQPIFHIDMFVTPAGRADDGRYRLLVGSPALAGEILGEPPPEHAMAPIFDDVAALLERQGFAVIRTPLPLTWVDDRRTRTRSWYFATANNCLVQVDADAGDAVWLPTYGHGPWADLAPVDAEMKRIWEGLGFAVTQLGDFNPFAQNLGSVHCIKKYLER